MPLVWITQMGETLKEKPLVSTLMTYFEDQIIVEVDFSAYLFLC